MKLTESYIDEKINGDDQTLKLILSDIKKVKNDFFELIRKRDYEFKDNLISRMRAFYQKKHLLYFDNTYMYNEGTKHRLSFVDAIWIEILDILKGRKRGIAVRPFLPNAPPTILNMVAAYPILTARAAMCGLILMRYRL